MFEFLQSYLSKDSLININCWPIFTEEVLKLGSRKHAYLPVSTANFKFNLHKIVPNTTKNLHY